MRSSRLVFALSVCIVTSLLLVTKLGTRVASHGPSLTNSPPVAVDDNYTIHGSLVINPLANDSDPDGDVVIFDGLASGPSHGSLAPLSGNQFRYTANSGYAGPDTFIYVVRDRFFASDTATVTISVVNQAPLANADSYTVHGTLGLNLLLNDSDADGDQIIFDGLATGPHHGVLVPV